MTSHYFRLIQVSLYSLGFILLGSLGIMSNVSAGSAPCGTISGGASVNISSDCSDLMLDGAGNVVINSGAIVASEALFTSIAINAQPGITASLSNSGTISAVQGDGAAYGIFIAGGIATLTNSGAILAEGTGFGTNAFGIFSSGDPITTLTNSGTISAIAVDVSSYAVGIYNTSTITTLTNSGSAVISGDATSIGGAGIYNNGTITTLTNSGSARISGTNVDDWAYGIYNNGTINTLTNSGSAVISGMALGAAYAFGILNDGGTINTLTNSDSAVISGTSVSGFAFGIYNSGTIGTLNNSSNAIILGPNSTSSNSIGILNAGLITTLNNSGTISAITAGGGAVGLWNDGTITSLNNSGTISAISAGGDSLGIYNAFGSIGTLNNLQGAGNAAGVLTYFGALPTNYNIIINSKSQYGQLSVAGGSGVMNFGIYSGSKISNGIYSGVLSSSDNTITLNNTSGKYGSANWLLSPEGDCSISCIWDLIISGYYSGPSTANTQQSLVNTANALAPVYAMQNAVVINSFTYDCTLFDVNNICISAGGRNTAVSAANGLNNTSALLIAAYRPHPNYRVGAYADQNLSVNNAGSTINLSNNTPLLGLFGAWNERLDGTGTEVKVSAAYGQKNTTITRQVVGTSEAGSGSSQLNSQGAQVMAKYGFAVTDKATVSPYVGVRYTQNNMGGYTEGASSTVTAPLTYSALNTNATTALAGVGASYKVIPTVTTFASAGVETDTNTSNGSYSATGVTGLTPVNFNPNPVRTRPTATVGAYYDIVKNQRLGITGIYRQEAYQAVATTTVMATYTIGL